MPTFGRVPTGGCIPLAFSLDRVGPLARTAWDCAAVLEVIDSPDFLSRIEDGLAGLRIGVMREHHLDGAEPEVVACFEAAVAALGELGAEVCEVRAPLYHELVATTLLTLWSEACAYHRSDLRTRWTDYTRTARTMMAAGAFVSAADYVQAQRVRRAGQRKLAELLAEVDLIAAPTVSMPAPALEQAMSPGHTARVHTMYWNSLGNPVLALPIGFTDGMPLGMQLAAAPFSEALLLRAGRAFQNHTDWHRRAPDLEVAHG